MTAWQEGDVEVKGVSIHYYRTGAGKDPLSVVMAHGITDNGLCWGRVAQALKDEYDLITYDARGHGQSSKPKEGYTYQDHASDLLGLVDALGLERPVVMGHSMGAQTALTFAAGHPDRVRAAILEDPPLRLNETAEVSEKEREAHYQEWRQRVEDYKTQSEDELMAMCRERSPEWSAADLPAWALSKRQVSADVLKIVQRPRSNWRQEMRGLRCPTLLITGDPDRGAIVTPEIADEAAALADDLVVVRVKGAGHNIRREGFEQYIAAVEGFLAGLED